MQEVKFLFGESKIPVSKEAMEDNNLANAKLTFQADGTYELLKKTGEREMGTYTYDAENFKLQMIQEGIDTFNYEVNFTENSLELYSVRVDLNNENLQSQPKEVVDVYFKLIYLLFNYESSMAQMNAITSNTAQVSYVYAR